MDGPAPLPDDPVFRHRFWIFGAIFFVGFSAYSFDPVNVVVGLLEWRGLDPKSPGFDDAARLWFGAGALLVIAAAALRTWASAYLTTDVVHDANLHDERLVADGPYRRVRNPLYLGVLLLVAGWSLCANRLGCAFMNAAVLALVFRLISHEEARLAAAQGEGYEAYRRAVPRLVPSLLPRVPASGRAPRFGQAFLGEAFFWAFAAGSVAMAITLDMGVLYLSTLGGLGVYAVTMMIAARLRRGRDGTA